jgi:hypothetical protein
MRPRSPLVARTRSHEGETRDQEENDTPTSIRSRETEAHQPKWTESGRTKSMKVYEAQRSALLKEGATTATYSASPVLVSRRPRRPRRPLRRSRPFPTRMISRG